MDFLITPLTQEQHQELKSMTSQAPEYYGSIVKDFQKNVKAYRDHNIYGIGTFFSKDVFDLARYYEYIVLKKLLEESN